LKDLLPPDAEDELDYASLIEMLRRLEGEEVCLLMSSGEVWRFQAKGTLRYYDYNWADGFAIGDGARMLVSELDFVSAKLRTYDGTQHFSIAMRFGEVAYVTGDPGMHETDEFDLFP
jgi:hypothetical protein